jgi:hypothetical protein
MAEFQAMFQESMESAIGMIKARPFPNDFQLLVVDVLY